MPNNGQLLEAWKAPADYGWPAMALRLQSAATITTAGSGTITYGHSGVAETNWTPDVNTTPAGMRLECGSAFDGTSGTWEVAYYGPGAPPGGFHASGAVFLATVSIEVRPLGVLLYSKLTGSLFRILWTSLEVYVNGSLHSTLSGFDGVSNGVGPNYVPILGMPVVLSGGGSATHSEAPVLPTCDDGVVPEDATLGGTAPSETLPTDYAGLAAYDACNPGAGLPVHYEATVDQVISGGWGFYTEGTWQSLPVATDVREAPSLATCANLTLGDVVVSTETLGDHLALRASRYYKLEYIGREYPTRSYVDVVCEDGTTRYYGTGDVECGDDGCGETRLYRDVYRLTNRTDVGGGSIRLQPDLDHDLVRLGDDHAALMVRDAMPAVRGRASRSCTSRVNSGDCVVRTSTQSFETHPALSDDAGVVGNSHHHVLDGLLQQFLAPTTASKSRTELVRYDYLGTGRVCSCPWPWFTVPPDPCGGGAVSLQCGVEWPEDSDTTWIQETTSWQFPDHVDYAPGGYQWHEAAEARYLGTWCNPWWHLGYWTEQPDGWLVDAEPLSWADYWGLVREQWFGNVWLAGSERTYQRNHLILSPVEAEQGHTPFLNNSFYGLRWVGVSRFKVLESIIPSGIQLSASKPGVWLPRDQGGTPDCTVTLGANITLSAFNVAEAWVDLDLAQWTQDPWLLLQLATRVRVGWDTANVDSLEVQLVGIDGGATSLGTVEGWCDFPLGERGQPKYAGSWAIDNGALAAADEGTDSDLANGISAATMASPDRAASFQLAYGQTFAYLRFVVVPTSMAGTVTLEWPEFELVSGDVDIRSENGKIQVALWRNGPGIRYGQSTHYLPIGGFQDPPITTGLGVQSTMVDALGAHFRLFTNDGSASLSGDITGVLGSYVDSYEGPASIAVVDKLGMGVLLPQTNIVDVEAEPSAVNTRLRFAMINSFAEVPPMACWPTRKRAAPTWVPSGADAYWAGVYDWTQRHRLLISGGAQLYIESAAGAAFGEPVVGLPAPWYGWRYAPALSNAEPDWAVRLDADTQLASVRPWHGFFAVYGAAGDRTPAVLETWEPRFVRATVQAGNIRVRHAAFSSPPYMVVTKVTDTGDCDAPCLAEDPRMSAGLILLYVREPVSGPDPAGVYERHSHDAAVTWDNEVMAFTGGKQPKSRTGDSAVVRTAFLYDSGTSGPGTIVATYQGDGDPTPSAQFTWQDSTGSDLSVEDSGYDLCHAPDEQERWMASLTIAGEPGTSDWFSTDGCRTWTRVP